MSFKSLQPDIDLPRHIPVWDWLFESPSCSTLTGPEKDTRGFTNALTKERISHLQVKELSTYLSTALVLKYGLKQGEVISICTHNSIWFPVGIFGILRAGGIASASSPSYTVDEMTYVLKTTKTRFIFTSSSCLQVVKIAAANVGLSNDCIWLLDGNVENFQTIHDLIEFGRRKGDDHQLESFKLPKGKSSHDVCALLCLSSGTTGLPKAVMISHQNIIAQCLQIRQITPSDHKVILGLLPFYHITGLVHMLHLPILINAEVVVLPTFTMKNLLETVSKYQIAELLIVPPIIIRLVRDPLVQEYDLSCVRRFSSGAAPLSPEILQLLQKKFPNAGFKQGYGMTESCSCIASHPPSKYNLKFARTVGTVVASTEIKIIDANGKSLGVDEKGEILARGPQCTMGYLDNPKSTAETFDPEGWLRTGDEGSINSDGLITIHDRIKELIKVKGVGVAPAELEDLLLGHPQVEDCAVIGVPDDYSGERPLGIVVLQPQVANTIQIKQALLEYVKERKARSKWLVAIEIVDQIPKSPSGKILRRVLRARLGNSQPAQRANL